MTVAVQTPFASFLASGSATFAYAFKVNAAADLIVKINGVTQASSLYSVTGVGTSAGSVVFISAPTAGAIVSIQRKALLQRITDYQNNGDFLAGTVNPDFDALWMALQDQQYQQTMALQLSPADIVGVNTTLPTPAGGTAIGWNAYGTALVNIVLSTGTSMVSLIASSGASLIGWIQSGIGAIFRSVQDKLREQVSVKDFGAVGDGVTDDQPACARALAYLISIGGGVLIFPPGTYNLVTTTSDGTVSQYFDLTNHENISFIGYGAKINCAWTSASFAAILFNMDGSRRINVEGFDVTGYFSRTLNVVNTHATVFAYMRSRTQDGDGITFKNIRTQGIETFLSANSDLSNSFRMRNVVIQNVFAYNGYYGINCANNCDNLTTINFRTTNFIRSYFPYGVSNHNINYQSYGGDVFTDCLIKAYQRDTTDITVKAKIIANTSNDSHVTIESQHNPGTQPIPAVLKNIVLDIEDLESSGTGPSLRFAYFQDPGGVETHTCTTTLFDNVTVRGNVRNYIDFNVAIPTDTGLLDISKLKYTSAGTANPLTKGFYSSLGYGVTSTSVSPLNVVGNAASNLNGGLNVNDYTGATVFSIDGSNGLTESRLYAPVNKTIVIKNAASGYSAGTLMVDFQGTTSSSFGVKFYEGANSSTPNAANTVVKIGQMNASGRSLGATGTLNASGADYAEYEHNNGLTISKGQIVGFKADGTLTLNYADAIRFGIKSTAPSFVGGDAWATDEIVGPAPDRVSRIMPEFEDVTDADGKTAKVQTAPGETDAEWAARESAYNAAWAAYQAKIEVERAKVDRIAYSGKVPANVTGATPGGYIVAVDSAGAIAGEFVPSPSFDQYRNAVGRVNRILPDGRCEVAVIVH